MECVLRTTQGRHSGQRSYGVGDRSTRRQVAPSNINHPKPIGGGQYQHRVSHGAMSKDMKHFQEFLKSIEHHHQASNIQHRQMNKKEKHCYIFNWNQGGWNSEWATNIRSARKQARERWANQSEPVLTINESSFKRVTMAELQRIMNTDGFN